MSPVRHPRLPRPTPLARGVLLALAALAAPAFAAEECGPAAPDGQAVCTPTGDPVPQVRYEGVTDFELVMKEGFVVDGNLLPEGDTAVAVYGNGDITLHAEDGTSIRAHSAWPAVDVVAHGGSATVRVDRVYGGNVGVSALADGDVSVWANYVEGGTAIDAYSLGGNVTVDVAAALGGAYGAGVSATTEHGNVLVLAGEVLGQGDFATGIRASTHDGSTAIEAGWVRAEGVGAAAIWAESWENGDVSVDVQTATSAGDGSAAILAGAGLGDVFIKAGWVGTSGNFGMGIGAFAFNGNVAMDIGGLSTEGDYTRGIDVQALGTVDIAVGQAFTFGAFADVINVETTGDVAVGAERLATYGPDAYALRILTSEDVAVDLGEVDTYGERSSALYAWTSVGDIAARVGRVHARATSGDWFAIGLGSGEGDVALQVDEQVRADSGYAITLGSMTGSARVLVAEGAEVYGEAIAIDSATALGTRVDIAGTVSSGTGPVLNIAGNDAGSGAADIRIGATGQLIGRLQLSGGDDVLANAGVFRSAGTSQFGAGTDRLVNAGDITLQDGATSMTFAGLERLENAGRVSLVNGATGDVFALDGTLHGASGGTLAIDLDLSDRSADRIDVGALSGTNALSLDFSGQGSLLGIDNVRVLTSNGAQTGDELTIAEDSRRRGFVAFRVAFDGLDSWLLESDLADEAYLAGAMPAGVRDLWRHGAQSVSSHLAATHDDADSSGVWVQAIGGDFEGTSDFTHAQGARELQWQGTHDGLQVGAEMAREHWRAGVTLGTGQATMDLGGPEQTRLDTLGAGLYARYENDGWFAGGVLRGERVDVEMRWDSIGLQGDGDGSAVGMEFEAGRRFELETLWIEPVLRLSWIDVGLPDQDGQAGDVHWEDSTMGTGELGLRLGATQGWKGVRPYASMSVAREFGDGDVTVYDIGADTVDVADGGERTFGRFAGGVEWTFGRVDLYGEFEARVGDMEGSSGRLGARIRF